VVFNDALRARQDAHAAGEKISDTQVQRRVVTLAKITPARQWLGEVASGRQTGDKQQATIRSRRAAGHG
jgi:hypothetical protein